MAMKIAACPPELPLWSIIEIEWWGQIKCRDRGGSIVGQRLDVYCGSGDNALDRRSKCWTWSNKRVRLIK
jgi:3D (Asp-Asp-Asp) domain-containing protein